MTTLNKRYNYGLDLFLLSIDEGIVGYRDDSLEVRRTSPNFAPVGHVPDTFCLLPIDCQEKPRAVPSSAEDSEL